MGKLVNLDGWRNILSSIGTRFDPREATWYVWDRRLSRETLESMYRSDGLARKVVNLLPDEGTRQWVEIEGDDEGSILDMMNELRLRQRLNATWRWSRLYGGALIVMLIDDGQGLEAPLDESAIRRIVDLKIYDRHQISWTLADLYKDPSKEKYCEPEFYTVNPYQSPDLKQGIATFRVHESRVLIIDGADVPTRERLQNQGWGGAVLDPVYRALGDIGSAYGYTSAIMRDFVQAVLSVSNLSDLIGNDDGEKLVQKRLEMLSLSRSSINTMLIDKEEQYVKHASSVTGLADLLDRFCMHLSAVSGIPQTKLFGKAPQGLNATGDADIRQWYDEVRSGQEDILRPLIERVAWLIAISSEWPKGVKPYAGRYEDLRICFKPLWQPSEREQAETRKIISDMDVAYIDHGVLLPEEVATSRFGGGQWSMNTTIDTALRDTPTFGEEVEP